MKPQTPASGIMSTYDMPDFKCYNVACICGTADHSIDVTVEYDESDITVTFYTHQTTGWWNTKVESIGVATGSKWAAVDQLVRKFVNSLWHRMSVTWNVWRHGYVKYSSTTILTPQQAYNFAEALGGAIVAVENNGSKDGKEIQVQRNLW